MTKVKHSCYKLHQKRDIIRKSYGVYLSPANKLCNSVMKLTDLIRTVISDSRFDKIRLLRT
ncbi:hypothetical protein [Phytobacter ursingii]|uniref:hypothetical protein n=1 Tax=Phytobacter ursingii TaxID=1972431 RepID=UPI000CD01B3B|nr:hypothetical protein C2U51_13445 [Enterobacteriaceae bacterium ENNIH1]RDT56133.1 hypothetical protein DXF93_04870 [Escherichia coli]